MDDPRNLWQNQEVEEMKLSVEELRAKAAKFQRRILRRNIREHVAALVVILFLARFLWETPDTVERIEYALLIAGAIYYMWHLWKWGSAKLMPADMGRADCTRYYRGELERQRDLLRGVWKWAIGPLVPGLALGCIYGIATASHADLWRRILGFTVSAAIIVIVGWINLRAARRLDGRIAELNRDLATIEP
jgi:hypothetical protein